jgi:CBS-domain-containing membrane protein
MLANDLMNRDVVTIRDDESVEALIDLVVREHIHGVPVLDAAGRLVGVVTQQDIFFSGMTTPRAGRSASPPRVRDIMTAPAVTATEDTEVLALCRLMTRLRIHRVPIVRDGAVTGIVSSLDVCAALVRGELSS